MRRSFLLRNSRCAAIRLVIVSFFYLPGCIVGHPTGIWEVYEGTSPKGEMTMSLQGWYWPSGEGKEYSSFPTRIRLSGADGTAWVIYDLGSKDPAGLHVAYIDSDGNVHKVPLSRVYQSDADPWKSLWLHSKGVPTENSGRGKEGQMP